MFTSKITANNNADISEHNRNLDDFIKDLNIPQLNEEEQESLEKDFTFEEQKGALTSFADNTSPGEDGFTKTFYETFFWSPLQRTLKLLQQGFFYKGSLSVSQRRETIILIQKGPGMSTLLIWRIGASYLYSILITRSSQKYWQRDWNNTYQS